MDASQYKDYVLTLLFMKYVSDRHAGRPDALIDIPAGGGFADIAALKGAKDIGERINTIIAAFAEANDLQGVAIVAPTGSNSSEPYDFRPHLRQQRPARVRGRAGGVARLPAGRPADAAVLRGVPLRERPGDGPATRRALPRRGGAVRHLRRTVRARLRVGRCARSFADGAGVRSSRHGREAPADLREEHPRRRPAPEDAGADRQGAGRSGSEAVQHPGGSDGRALRGTGGVPRTPGTAALGTVRRGAVHGRVVRRFSTSGA